MVTWGRGVGLLPGGVTLPFALVTETYTEYKPVSYVMDESVAESLLRGQLEQTLRESLLRGEIVSEEILFTAEPGLVTASLTAECLERIDAVRRIEWEEVFGYR